MKQVTLVSKETFEINEVPMATYGPKQALLKVKAVGICGSDIHAYYGKHPFITSDGNVTPQAKSTSAAFTAAIFDI